MSTLVPDSAYFAGRHGDGLYTVGGQKPEIYTGIIKNFEQGARDAGKDPSTMPRLIELNVDHTDDEESALQCMRDYWAGTFVPALVDQKIYTPKMSQQNGEVVGADVMKQKMCLSANPADHVNYVREHIDLGFTHFFFHCAGPDQKGFLERYGRDVLPRIRQAAGQPADR